MRGNGYHAVMATQRYDVFRMPGVCSARCPDQDAPGAHGGRAGRHHLRARHRPGFGRRLHQLLRCHRPQAAGGASRRMASTSSDREGMMPPAVGTAIVQAGRGALALWLLLSVAGCDTTHGDGRRRTLRPGQTRRARAGQFAARDRGHARQQAGCSRPGSRPRSTENAAQPEPLSPEQRDRALDRDALGSIRHVALEHHLAGVGAGRPASARPWRAGEAEPPLLALVDLHDVVDDRAAVRPRRRKLTRSPGATQ